MEAKQTPLIELLERIPQDARLVVEHDQFSSSVHPVGRLCREAAAALRAALEQPEQEPVAWKDRTYGNLHHQDFGNSIPLYTAPPQRKPLTNSQRDAIARQAAENDWHDYEIIDAVEAAHGIKE